MQNNKNKKSKAINEKYANGPNQTNMAALQEFYGFSY
jgi:hypothetical protein